ncbi:MAG: ankyrin repeat domain-containing protein, partial [Verrucomicrobiota bacterium]
MEIYRHVTRPLAGVGLVPIAAVVASVGLVTAAGTIAYKSLTRVPTAAELLQKKGYLPTKESLFRAVEQGDIEALSLMTRSGIDFRVTDHAGRTPLISAIDHRKARATEFLLPRSSRLDAQDDEKRTALSVAVDQGDRILIEGLLDHGACLNATVGQSAPLLVTAAQSGNLLLLELLYGEGSTSGLNEALAESVSRKDRDIMEFLLRKGANPNYFHDGAPLLHHAVRSESLILAKILLTYGAEINRRAEDGTTSLEIPLDTSKATITRALLGLGADANLPDSREELPLFVALDRKDHDLARTLLLHGADHAATDREGYSPLGRSFANADRRMSELILDAGASPDAPCFQHLTPLEYAFDKNDVETAAFLLKRGTIPHPSLFLDAIDAGAQDIAKLLLEHGADVNELNEDGDTPLLHCIKRGDDAMVDFLLWNGADIQRIGAEGQEPLVIAVAARRPTLIQKLVDHGADPNVKLRSPASSAFREFVDSRTVSWYLTRDSRFTPLMIAAGIGDPDTLRVLLKNGASTVNYTRRWKRYPISFASESKSIIAQQIIVGADPAEQEKSRHVIIDLSAQSARLYVDGVVVVSSNVSTGKSGYRTPPGEYVITHKHRHWNSTIYGSSMPYFMRLSCGSFGMHVGNCPGYPASHGCIRMPWNGA